MASAVNRTKACAVKTAYSVNVRGLERVGGILAMSVFNFFDGVTDF